MRLLVLADIHGKLDNLSKMVDKINEDTIDYVLCSGDFIDEYNIPHGFTLTDIIDVFVQKLLAFGKPVYCVPGNVDPVEIIDVFEEYGINIHNKKGKINKLNIIGWGGALTPFHTMFEPTEAETKKSLEKLSSGIKNFILLLHNPPKNTKLDLVNKKHVGSVEERKFIENKKPLLVISAHIHEAAGTDKLGSSILFNPGAVSEGFYGLVEINRKSIKCVQKTIS